MTRLFRPNVHQLVPGQDRRLGHVFGGRVTGLLLEPSYGVTEVPIVDIHQVGRMRACGPLLPTWSWDSTVEGEAWEGEVWGRGW